MIDVPQENRLKKHLLAHGSACGVGVSDAEIRAFELQNKVTLPDDLRAYFRKLNGTAGDYAYGIIEESGQALFFVFWC
jgi:hypothetical protein